MKKWRWLVSILTGLVLMPVLVFAKTSGVFYPSNDLIDRGKPNGEFEILVLKDNAWQKAGGIGYSKYFRERALSLENLHDSAGEVKLRIRQKGGGAAHIDSVFLGGKPPLEVKNLMDGAKKLSESDFDVIDATKPVEVTFGPDTKDKILKLTARIENRILTGHPFQFPLSNLGGKVDSDAAFYSYKMNSHVGSLNMNGILDEIGNEAPFLKEYCPSGSGHPSTDIYGWVRNDSENLYVAIDFTGDNTLDGDKDYSKVYIRNGKSVREFKVSVPETRWGRPGFSYTDKVNYQHKTYEFKIPLTEIKAEEGDNIRLAFSAYGTDAVASYIYEALIDSDNNADTGGTVHVVQLGQSEDLHGIDYRVIVFFDDLAGILGPTRVFGYQQGSGFVLMSTDTSTYAIGYGNGYQGSAAAEFRALKSLLNNPSGNMKIFYHATVVALGSDYTAPILFQDGTIPIPTLSEWGMIIMGLFFAASAAWIIRKRSANLSKALIVLMAVIGITGLAWAATIVLDGQVDDWNGINAHLDDQGDSSNLDPNEDIWAGYVTSDNQYFYFRMDTDAGGRPK
jgi:hypothetical protein